METDGSETGGTNTTSEAPPAASETFKPITTQADLDALLRDRLNRERNKYADYKDVKAKAERLDQLEEANKSELQKMTDRLNALEKERDDAAARTLRLEVAADYGIPRDDAELFLTGTDETTLKRQAQRLVDRDTERKKNGNHVPREGANPVIADNDERATARLLFGGAP